MAFSTWSAATMAVQICTRLSFTIRLRTRGRLSKPLWKRLEGIYRVKFDQSYPKKQTHL